MLVGWLITTPGHLMFLVIHPNLCPPGKCVGIHFWGGGTYRVDFIIPNDRMMIVKITTSRGDLQFNVRSEPQCRLDVPHNTKLMPCQRWRKGFWHEEKSSLGPARIELSTGGQCLTPRPLCPHWSLVILCVGGWERACAHACNSCHLMGCDISQEHY